MSINDSYLTSFMKRHLSPVTMFEWLLDRMRNGKTTPKDDIELMNEYIYRLHENELDEVDYREDNFRYTFWASKGIQKGTYVLEKGNWLDLMFDGFGYKWKDDLDLVNALFFTVARGYGDDIELKLVEGENVL